MEKNKDRRHIIRPYSIASDNRSHNGVEQLEMKFYRKYKIYTILFDKL